MVCKLLTTIVFVYRIFRALKLLCLVPEGAVCLAVYSLCFSVFLQASLCRIPPSVLFSSVYVLLLYVSDWILCLDLCLFLLSFALILFQTLALYPSADLIITFVFPPSSSVCRCFGRVFSPCLSSILHVICLIFLWLCSLCITCLPFAFYVNLLSVILRCLIATSLLCHP